MEDFYTSKIICFLIGKSGNRYRMYICESSRRKRPKDLTLLGKCKEFKYPYNESNMSGHFSWGKVAIRDILWGYEDQLKVEAAMK